MRKLGLALLTAASLLGFSGYVSASPFTIASAASVPARAAKSDVTRVDWVYVRPAYVRRTFRVVRPTVYLRPRYVRPTVYLRPNYVRPTVYLRPSYVRPTVYLRPNYVRPTVYLRPNYVRPTILATPTYVAPTVVTPLATLDPFSPTYYIVRSQW